MSPASLSKYDRWSAERIVLWHNWFEHLPSLVRNAATERSIPEWLSRWDDNYVLLLQWIKDAPEALSPAQTLTLPAFSLWPDEFRTHYAGWIHAKFLQASPLLSHTVDELLGKLDEANTSVQRFVRLVRSAITQEQCDQLSGKLESVLQIRRRLPDRVAWPESDRTDLPEILVVDDLLGRCDVLYRGKQVVSDRIANETRSLRRAFCNRFRLQDVDALDEHDAAKHAIARVRFHSAQKWHHENGFVNDLYSVNAIINRDKFALILVDVVFNTGQPNENGQGPSNIEFGIDEVIPALVEAIGTTPIAALTSRTNQELIRRIRGLGIGYLHKSNSTDIDLVYYLLKNPNVTAEQLRNAMSVPDDFIAEDRRTLGVVFQAWKAARDESVANVLVLGESGAGKERLARFIHESSPRAGQPFEVAPCPQYPETRADADLFGYYGGAYTGANASDTEGVFQRGHGGTVFLDEFADLAAPVQPKLLRTLDSGRGTIRDIQPVGQPRTNSRMLTSVDVKIICATCRDVHDEKLVRADLLNRAKSDVTITIPPLRERPADIVPLARFFLSNRSKKPGVELDEEACRYLSGIPLQGNTRDLWDILSRATVGKGSLNLLMREDLEAAWSEVRVATPSRVPAQEPSATSEAIPSSSVDLSSVEAHSAIASLADAVAHILKSAKQKHGWDGLTEVQKRQIDAALRGNVPNVIAELAKWACHRSNDIPSMASYVTGTDFTGDNSYAKQLVDRLVSVDGVAELLESYEKLPGGQVFKDGVANKAEKQRQRTRKHEHRQREKRGD